MAAAARISLHIHKLVSKKGHWFLKKEKILPKLFESLVNIVTSFVWLRLYWLRLRRRKPLLFQVRYRYFHKSKAANLIGIPSHNTIFQVRYRYFHKSKAATLIVNSTMTLLDNTVFPFNQLGTKYPVTLATMKIELAFTSSYKTKLKPRGNTVNM